jgi:hypothetical protein
MYLTAYYDSIILVIMKDRHYNALLVGRWQLPAVLYSWALDYIC